MDLKAFLQKYEFKEFTSEHYDRLKSFVESKENTYICEFIYDREGGYCGVLCPFSRMNNINGYLCGENESMPIDELEDNWEWVKRRTAIILSDYESTLGFWGV